MKFTTEQKKAIKRICEDYDFENAKELKDWFKENYDDDFDSNWFYGKTEEECYKEIQICLEF